MLGLQWSDVLVQGNNLGMGLGQPTFGTATRNGADQIGALIKTSFRF